MAPVVDVPGGPAPVMRARDRYVSAYSELSRRVQAEGLLQRRYGYYWSWFAVTLAALVLLWVGVAVLGDSWFQLVLAGVLAVVLTQFGFLGHDAAHRQVFASHHWNEWAARVLSGAFTGLSYDWWISKHNRHHAAPNQEGRDPDIGPGLIAFTPAAVSSRTGLAARAARYQGWLFFPLLTLEGLHLHVQSVATVLRRGTVKRRWVEASLLIVRLVGYVAALLLLLPPGKAAAFLAVQMALFGLLLGGAFAPNHKGMPIVPAGMKVDFLRRQVLMSRNIRGGHLTDFAMGGLNYQIEHHLFPSMPRPNLKRAQPLVRAHCARHEVAYTETTLPRSYGIVVRYLNAVGLKARDPFECPLVARYRA